MTVNLLTIKDIRSYLDKELKDLYDHNETAFLSKIITKTIFAGAGLHEIYNPVNSLSAVQKSGIINYVDELKKGKPYQYVLGETEFYNCIIKVSPAVLIPRPETEELVDIIIKENRNFKGDIIDFGSGSGCIAIALKRHIPGADLTSFDISDDALRVAELNASINNVNVRFEKNDILNFQNQSKSKAGIIVSNPPYVRNSEKSGMKKNVLDFEPGAALFVDDNDPLIFYRAILEISENILQPGGKVYFEINEALGTEMKDLLKQYDYSCITIIKDLNDRDRFAKAIRNE